MVNPVVLIATHKRLPITTENLRSLERQTVAPKVVLVVSDDQELNYYRDAFPSVVCFKVDNEPLGAKWQAGVCAVDDADPLIITGSDDILGNTFVENACKFMSEGAHFIGLQRFWQHYKRKAYLCDYNPMQPIGGGRVYSKKMLEHLEYKLFDIGADRHLDDFVWNRIRTSGLKVKWCRDVEKDGLEIHAVKGSWPMMNRFNARHVNIKLIRVDNSERILPDISCR